MRLNNYIGGSWQGEEGADYTAVTNPANGEELAQVRLSTKEDVDQAVKAAKEAQKNGHLFRHRNVQIIYMKLDV